MFFVVHVAQERRFGKEADSLGQAHEQDIQQCIGRQNPCEGAGAQPQKERTERNPLLAVS